MVKSPERCVQGEFVYIGMRGREGKRNRVLFVLYLSDNLNLTTRVKYKQF